jgi:hypothetical protein
MTEGPRATLPEGLRYVTTKTAGFYFSLETIYRTGFFKIKTLIGKVRVQKFSRSRFSSPLLLNTVRQS